MDIASVKDIKTSGKRVLVRVDFNVPQDEKTGAITDDSRIRAALPTIQHLIRDGAKVVLCSHLGRPRGADEKLRMGVVAERLSKLIGRRVAVTKDCIGPDVENAVVQLKNGDVLMLENLRFHAEEEKNDDAFSRSLARLADVYVDDAFGTAHRAHASVVGVTKYLPSVAGLLLLNEIETLGGILENPVRPFAGLFGGAKVSDKVALLKNVMNKIDYILVGGGMAATFLKAKSYEIGQSLVEANMVSTAAELMDTALKTGAQLLLPVDVVVAESTGVEAKRVMTVPVEKVPPDLGIVDIGPKTVKSFQDKLALCKTVFWNGPMGVYETPCFAGGTKEMAKFLANLSARTIVGGGSTADVVNEMGLTDKMTFVSTGGGASLSFLSGETLPGVKVLLNRQAIPKELRSK